jgi:hypothetical protein
MFFFWDVPLCGLVASYEISGERMASIFREVITDKPATDISTSRNSNLNF